MSAEALAERQWESVQAVIEGYVNAALWTEELDRRLSAEDLSETARIAIAIDCQHFLVHNQVLLSHAGLGLDQIGHDLWLTRNGHGTGFWDRDLGDLGDALADAARDLGHSALYESQGVLYVG